ncbi:hypothetical protein Tco_0805402 [Tanacetum coccineum]
MQEIPMVAAAGSRQVKIYSQLDSSQTSLEGSPDETTWEWLSCFQSAYPTYNLEGTKVAEWEGNVTSEVVYNERANGASVAPIWHADLVMGYDYYHSFICFRIRDVL